MLRNSSTCAWIKSSTLRIVRVMNSRNSSSTHSMIPRRFIYITTETTSSYFGLKFQKQNLLFINKKPKGRKIDTHTEHLFFIFCSNIILTKLCITKSLFQRSNIKWHMSPSSLTIFFRSVLNYYFLNDRKFTLFGMHFIVKLQLDNTSAYTTYSIL